MDTSTHSSSRRASGSFRTARSSVSHRSKGSDGSTFARSESLTSVASSHTSEFTNDLTIDEDPNGSEHADETNEVGGGDGVEVEVDMDKLSPIHKQLLLTLQHSARLSPINVGVENVSYWYYSRKQLSAKRQMIVSAKQNQHTFKWEGQIYQMKPNDEYDMVPQLVAVSRGHKTKALALERAEKFCKERDMNLADKPGFDGLQLADKLMQTHFKIRVVSEAFYRLSNFERVVMIWEEILAGEMGQALVPLISNESNPVNWPPINGIKLASTWGHHMCALDAFRALYTKFPLHLIISAKTPSQWKPHLYPVPLNEKYGVKGVGTITSTALQQQPQWDLKSLRARVNKLSRTHVGEDTTGQHNPIFDIVNKKANASGKKKRASTIVAGGIAAGATGSKGAAASGVEGNAAPFLPPINDKYNLVFGGAHPAHPHNNNNLGDTLGLPPDISGVAYNKAGGVFGHFFSDLSSGVRSLVMEKVNENKIMIQRAGFNNYYDRPPPGDNSSMASSSSFDGSSMLVTNNRRQKLRRRGHRITGDYDIGTHSEGEMWDEFRVQLTHYQKLAVRLQRIRRQATLRHAAACAWRRKYATLVIQKLIRGWITRRIVVVMKNLFPLAVVRLQQAYRKYRSRNIINTWAWAVLRMSRVIVKRLKQFVLLSVRRWYVSHVAYVIRIQSLIRMHLQRVRYFKMIGELFHAHVATLAAIIIQRVVRGRFVRKNIYHQLCEQEMILRIDIPSAIRIQRVWRGYLGKQRAIYQRALRVAVKMLQAVVRRFVHRVWYRQMRIERIRNESALTIQRHYRGRIDRELVRRLRVFHDYTKIYIPAVILVQKHIRRCNAMRRYQVIRKRYRSAIVIQRYVRRRKHRLIILAKWHALLMANKHINAREIQKIVRGYLARLGHVRRVLVKKGQLTGAAKVIMRAWVNYKQAKRMQFLLDAHRLTVLSKRLERVEKVRMGILEDRAEILEDVGFAKQGVAACKQTIQRNEVFIVEVQLRLPRIKEELMGLSAEDIDRGWPEALKQEFESLSRRAAMAKEENRVRRAALMRLETEERRLLFELEETDIELDSIACTQMETYEGYRRAEVGLIERKVNDKHNRQIRVERCRWKVDSTRLHKINRKYDALLEQNKKQLGLRDMAYAETINFEVRAAVQDHEELLFKQQQKKARKLPAEKKYELYAGPVQTTYDAVLDNSLSILRQFTLDDRISRMKKAQKEKQGNQRKTGLGEFAPLKSAAELAGINMPVKEWEAAHQQDRIQKQQKMQQQQVIQASSKSGIMPAKSQKLIIDG